MQSEKSKKAGNSPSTTLLVDFLKTSYVGSSEILLLEEDMNFNSRATSLLVSSASFFLGGLLECQFVSVLTLLSFTTCFIMYPTCGLIKESKN